MMVNEPIRVFVSYSGDDWEEFVKPLGTILRTNGIDARLANWDIHGGESLVQRILNEEIPLAEAVVVVLSKTSVTKPWVQEELDHATVRRIVDKIRLIPFKIDNCEVPPSLSTLKRISIHGGDDALDKMKEVVDAIYQISEKPPLGEPPSYIRSRSYVYPELSSIEAQVLDILIADCVQTGYLEIDVHRNTSKLRESGLSDTQINRGVAKLKARGYLREKRVGNGFHLSTSLSSEIAADYARERFSGFDDRQVQIVADVATVDPNHGFWMASIPDDIPAFVYRSMVEELVGEGIIKATWTWGKEVILYPASPFIDEWLEEHQ